MTTTDPGEMAATVRIEAQRKSDQLHSELNELYRQVFEKEAEIAKIDRVVYPEDYQP